MHNPVSADTKISSFSKRVFFQPKLSINTPGDAYEQEADAMADKVMRIQIPESQNTFFKPAVASIQRKCAACDQKKACKHNFFCIHNFL